MKPQDQPQESLLIVGVAASAGGLDALRELLGSLPADANLALVIAQHLSPHHRSVLADLLGRETALAVRTAEHGDLLAAGTAYVAPSNHDIVVEEGRICLLPPPDRVVPKPSADRLFRSLAAHSPESCAGVVLSGTGSDGAAGVRAIKAAGGTVFVQEPTTAAYDGMPRAALATGCADPVPTLAGMAERLVWLSAGDPPENVEFEGGDALARIIRRVYRDRRMDLSAYREATLLRRLHRRLVATGCDDLDAYERLLADEEQEIDRLCRELLISVTEFFRDRQAFVALRRALEHLLERRPSREGIRIWVPGCATGEEAYSIAILLAELLDEELPNHRIQLFATDLDEAALKEARYGAYPVGAVQELPRSTVERFFVREWNHVRVIKPLREMVVFARQDLLNDPPFTRLDLISCRNVLIYLRPETQQRLLELFHYALRHSGRLLLGRAEGVGGREYLYAPIDSAQRLYQRRNDVESTPPRLTPEGPRRGASRAPTRPLSGADTLHERAVEATLEAYAPPNVLVDPSGTVLRSHHSAEFVALPEGEATLSVQALIRDELRSSFITLLARSHREGAPQEGIPVRLPDRDEPIRLRVIPVPGEERGDPVRYLVFFESTPHAVDSQWDPDDVDAATQDLIGSLRSELTATREHLGMISEELERANQELQSTNEELQSSNEELQSTNEELETSNEELQSTNEELTTVNEELARRGEALSAAYDDLNNIMDSLADPLLVLDDALRVKRFNAAATTIFELDPARIGVPITAIPCRLDLGDLGHRLGRVLRDGTTEEEQISQGGESFLLRLRPYRDCHEELHGCLLLLIDQSGVVRAEQGLRASQARLIDVLRHAPLLAAFTNTDGRFDFVNPAFERFFRLRPGEAVGRAPGELLPAGFAEAMVAGDRSVRASRDVSAEECSVVVDAQTYRLWLYRIPLFDGLESGRQEAVCTLALDATEWWRAVSQVRLQAQALDSATEGMIVTDASGSDQPITYCNRAFVELTGYAPEEVYGQNCRFLQGPDTEPEALEQLREAIARQEPVEVTLTNYRKDGTPFPNYLRINPICDEAGKVTHFLGIQTDVSEEQAYRRELIAAKAQAEAASRAKTEFLSSMSHELRTPLNAILGFTQLLYGEAEPDSPTRQRYYEHVLHAGWFLRDLINEVLDLARIEAGQLMVNLEPQALVPLIEQCVAFTWGEAEQRAVTVETHFAAGVTVLADPVRTRQIVTNLLSNAIKYNRHGGRVTLTVYRESDWVVVDVVDTGRGLDAAQQERLFRPFERLGQERGTIEGSGIGLVVSRHLAELMDGRLELAVSEPGRGSTFRLHLPSSASPPVSEAKAVAQAPAAPAPYSTDQPLLRVLYVEDNELNRTLVRGLMARRPDVALTEAVDGASGLAAAEGASWDLILLDLHLPDMTGFDIVEVLQERGVTARTPVVAVSADALSEQRERAVQSGFFDYLVKPFLLEDLERLLELGRSAPFQSEEPRGSDGSGAEGSIGGGGHSPRGE